MIVIPKNPLELMISGARKNWLGFIDNLRSDSLDFVLVDYPQLDEDNKNLLPHYFSYVSKNSAARTLSLPTYDEEFMQIFGYEAKEMVEVIDNILGKKDIPRYEGMVNYLEDWGDGHHFTNIFSIGDSKKNDPNGLRTMRTFQGWREEAGSLPKEVEIHYSFRCLNLFGPPGADRGDAGPMEGFYSFATTMYKGANLKFFGDTIQMAKYLLGEDFATTLPEDKLDLLQQKLLALLDPLKEKGYKVIEKQN